jgi:hypothetical protein
MKVTASGRKTTKTPDWRWEKKKKVDSDKKRSLKKRRSVLHGDGSEAIYFVHPRLLVPICGYDPAMQALMSR